MEAGTDMMTVSTVAERLDVSDACVYAIIAAGDLRCYRIGVGRGAIRISEEQLQDYLDKKETGEKPKTSRPVPVKLKHLS